MTRVRAHTSTTYSVTGPQETTTLDFGRGELRSLSVLRRIDVSVDVGGVSALPRRETGIQPGLPFFVYQMNTCSAMVRL